MIEEPGSFSGRRSSPKPDLGPLPKNLKSFAIFIKEQAIVLRLPENSTIASFVCKLSNLFGDVLKWNPVSLLISYAIFTSNPMYVFNPVPTAVPPYANSLNIGSLDFTLSIEFLIIYTYPENS